MAYQDPSQPTTGYISELRVQPGHKIAVPSFRLVHHKLHHDPSLGTISLFSISFRQGSGLQEKNPPVGSGLAPLLVLSVSERGRHSLKFTFDTCISQDYLRHNSANWLVGCHSFKTISIRPSTFLALGVGSLPPKRRIAHSDPQLEVGRVSEPGTRPLFTLLNPSFTWNCTSLIFNTIQRYQFTEVHRRKL